MVSRLDPTAMFISFHGHVYQFLFMVEWSETQRVDSPLAMGIKIDEQ